MNINLMQILFLVSAVIILIAAVLAVTVRNLVHAALWMVLSFFGIAILFALLGTGFFAVIQVVIYIGAIAVLILFTIMLTSNSNAMGEKEPSRTRYWWLGALAVSGLFAILVFVLRLIPESSKLISAQPDNGLVTSLGKALVEPGQFGIVFEIASILLLIALIAAIYLAQDRNSGNRGDK